MSDPGEPPKIFYVLVCRLCGRPGHRLPVPFGSPEERGRWAAGHTKATGHDSWFVLDQPEDPAAVPEIQVLFPGVLQGPFREWLALRGLYLFPIPVEDRIPVFGIGIS